MHKEKRKRKQGKPQVFRAPGIWWVNLSIVLIVFGGPALSFRLGLGAGFCGSLIFLALAIFMFTATLSRASDKVILSTRGIEFNIRGRRGQTTWDNLEAVELRDKQLGIALYAAIPVVDPDSGQTTTTFIPLNRILYWKYPRNSWLDTEKVLRTPLGRALFDHAPYLFDIEKLKHEADA